MSDRSRIRLRITGRVQGVGFRWFVREHARRLGLAGWVRNEPDGAVLLEAGGPEDLVGSLRTAVGTGPSGAQVERIEELEAESGSLPTPFAVER